MTFASGEAARRGLTAGEIAAADREDGRVEQAKLDEADLRQLERAEYYDDPMPLPAGDPTPRARGFLGRLLDHIRPVA